MSDSASSSQPNVPSSEVIRELPDRETLWLLEDPSLLKSLIQILEPQIAQRLDVQRAQRINRSLIPEDLKKKETDLIFRIPYQTAEGNQEREVLVYVLLEHQSKPDPLMPLRLLHYITQLWEEQRRAAEDAGVPAGRLRLIPVIPLVFYTGEESWNSAFTLSELMDLPSELVRFVPGWDTLFLNLHGTSSETLTRFSSGVGYALQVLQAEQAPLEEMERVLAEALMGLEGLSSEQSGQWLRVAWYLMLLVYHRRERSDYDTLSLRILEQTRGSRFSEAKEVEIMVQSMAQYVAEQAEERGRVLGEAQGRALGKAEALRTVLTVRFGALPSEVEVAIEDADIQQLEQWLTLALTADNLEAVGIR